MDFGPDSFLCSNNGGSFALDGATAEIHKQKCYGFGFLKQERERAVNEDELLREFKMAKTCSSSSSSYTEAAMLRFPLQRSSNGGTEAHQQMLSFSSPNSSPYYHQSSTPFARNSGYGYGGSMQGVRGPFTPSQWMELEHQALIYKYLNANVPIPSYLLNPIRKAFESAAFSSSLPSNPLGGRGWGGFQLGFANTDPEPGRCRRTDGKKWRCSRDAVADQKYCERHINRGRHRSRKPVEAHSKLTPIPSSTSLLPSAAPATTYLPTTTTRVEPKEQAAFQESSFGLVCSDSLLNPLNRSSSLIKNYDHKPDHHHHHHHPLRQFMDEWPKTQLSISIPMAVASDFTSSTSSPTNEKPTSPPPRLSGELEMGLGVGTIGSQRQANWVPISWEPSMGGPLGEVLQTTSNSTSECKNTQQPLNLIDRWDNHSPGMASSPTGVLQRAAFASLSNSSATSSPRAEGINAGPMNP